MRIIDKLAGSKIIHVSEVEVAKTIDRYTNCQLAPTTKFNYYPDYRVPAYVNKFHLFFIEA
jgi:hypothetical protein